VRSSPLKRRSADSPTAELQLGRSSSGIIVRLDEETRALDNNRALAEILEWTTADENVRAVVVTGSTARGPEQVDRLSDLDVELYVREPQQLLDSTSWYEQFGTVLVVEALSNPGWHPTRLIYYRGGKIDFAIAPTAALAEATYARPFRVLLDKDGLTAGLAIIASPSHPPDANAYLQCVQWFYAAALMCAKCVVRDEPWMAKFRDWDLKREMLRMIEWDHKARYGWSYETWFNGKCLDRWVDGDVRARLDACWANFSVAESAAALRASVDLFDHLSTRTAHRVGLAPFNASPVRAEVISTLELRTSEM
jgi:aminoglycoside 6-adenylyltransferase